MNCPYCDEEIIYGDATNCPKCGEPITPEDNIEQSLIEVPLKQTDLVLGSAILTIISAGIVGTIGYTGIYQQQVLLDYYGASLASDFLGFLIFGIIGIISASVALIGSIFIVQRKQFKISIIGTIFPLVSVIGTYITIQQYQYGYTDTILFAEPLALILTIMSTIFLFKSKKEFT